MITRSESAKAHRPRTRGAALDVPRNLRKPLNLVPLIWCGIAQALTGCGAAAGNAGIAGGVVGGTLLLAQAPGQEIEQVYYLGVFDPREQLPTQVYRVTVHGQASTISSMRFGSGWVPAKFIDSLSAQIRFEQDTTRPSITGADKEQEVALATGRRLMMFGPEGFREAPKDYRLVIVMGASPQAFFNAIDQSVGIIAQVQQAKNNSDVLRQLAQARQQLQSERDGLSELDKDVATDLPDNSAAGAKQ